jgi:hypothetical protein
VIEDRRKADRTHIAASTRADLEGVPTEETQAAGSLTRRPASYEEWADELSLAIENAIAYGWMGVALSRVQRYKDWKKSKEQPCLTKKK